MIISPASKASTLPKIGNILILKGSTLSEVFETHNPNFISRE